MVAGPIGRSMVHADRRRAVTWKDGAIARHVAVSCSATVTFATPKGAQASVLGYLPSEQHGGHAFLCAAETAQEAAEWLHALQQAAGPV